MAKRKKSVSKKPIEQYEHKDKKRLNNPPVGLVTPKTDKDGKKKNISMTPILILNYNLTQAEKVLRI